MRNIWWAVVLVLAVGGIDAAAAATPTVAPDDVIVGAADAPVTIIEYASLTCPHCAEFDTDTLPKVKAEWIDPGKARLIYRDYPLDQNAVKAAMLARCAPPARFFGFIDELFHSQQTWVLTDDPVKALQRIALLGGIGPDKFDACMKNQAIQDRVLNERLVAQNQYGVDSTPTFFINGTKLVGSLPYDQFAKALTAALGNKPVAQVQGESTPATPPPTASAPAAAPPGH